MSNREKGGMADSEKRTRIAEALEDLSADVLDILYRIIFYAESGLE